MATTAGAQPHSSSPKKTKSSAKPHATAGSRQRGSAEKSTTVSDWRGIVRVYRHGLGDCILIRLARRTGGEFKILIDCGVAVATEDAPGMMKRVVDDILKITDKKIDVLVVTHEHWDHVSGFTQAESEFKKLEIGEVWVAWTEDPKDDLAKKLKSTHAQAFQAVQASAQAMAQFGDGARARGIFDVLSLFGAAGEKTKEALDRAKNLGSKPPRYCSPHDPPVQLNDPKIRIYFLGPPHDEKLIRRTLPSKVTPETYELAIDGGGLFPLGVASALALLEDEDAPPFSPTVAIPMEAARTMSFFQNHYWGGEGALESWRQVDSEWLGAADDLALALQSATNKTSLLLAIEFLEPEEKGDVLLFAGDAQVGNWLSWQDLRWALAKPSETTGPDLLRRTIFYKVGHHGSHNATLRQKGLE